MSSGQRTAGERNVSVERPVVEVLNGHGAAVRGEHVILDLDGRPVCRELQVRLPTLEQSNQTFELGAAR